VEDEATLQQLAAVGVDGLVVPRGSVSLGAQLPVVRLQEPPVLPAEAAGVLLSVRAPDGELAAGGAEGMWHALARDLEQRPAELLLDLPELPVGLAEFLARLREVSDVPVVPVVTAEQLRDPAAVAAVEAAGACVVLAFGNLEPWRPGARALQRPLRDQLAPLQPSGVRPRIGISLTPLSDPALASWPASFDPLTPAEVAETSTAAVFDRVFTLRTGLEWAGRRWQRGDRIALGWLDVPRLDAALESVAHLGLPDPGGWDLMPLPPANAAGISREALIAYLGGEGPELDLEVDVSASRSTVRVEAVNRTPFPSAVSSYSNFVQVWIEDGLLVANDRGSFDRVMLGRFENGEFESSTGGSFNAVRFIEHLVAPNEALSSGSVRRATRSGTVRVSWQIVLSTGDVVGETVQ
jgi:hypothetical protein